jgi:hypothetical protein
MMGDFGRAPGGGTGWLGCKAGLLGSWPGDWKLTVAVAARLFCEYCSVSITSGFPLDGKAGFSLSTCEDWPADDSSASAGFAVSLSAAVALADVFFIDVA